MKIILHNKSIDSGKMLKAFRVEKLLKICFLQVLAWQMKISSIPAGFWLLWDWRHFGHNNLRLQTSSSAEVPASSPHEQKYIKTSSNWPSTRFVHLTQVFWKPIAYLYSSMVLRIFINWSNFSSSTPFSPLEALKVSKMTPFSSASVCIYSEEILY